jgi:hypothetical protein
MVGRIFLDYKSILFGFGIANVEELITEIISIGEDANRGHSGNTNSGEEFTYKLSSLAKNLIDIL